MGYEKVLVAVEPNHEADVIVRKARELAADGTRPTIVSVLPDLTYLYGTASHSDAGAAVTRALSEARNTTQSRVSALARRHGIPEDHIHVISGSPAREVRKLADELKADCIVMGTHGQRGIRLLIGSTANALIHGLPCDAYFVRTHPEDPAPHIRESNRVICAVDESSDADQIFGRALQVADQWQAPLTLATVIRPIVQSYGGLDLAMLSAAGGSFEREALSEAEHWLAELDVKHGKGRDIAKVARLGLPADELHSLAEDTGAALIVVGSHGRYGVARVLGSTANAVLHGVACDVLVVRIRDTEESDADASQSA